MYATFAGIEKLHIPDTNLERCMDRQL